MRLEHLLSGETLFFEAGMFPFPGASCLHYLFLIVYPGVMKEAGGLAQLARALASHARGRRFESDILHVEGE